MLIREALEKDVLALSELFRREVEHHRYIARYYDLLPDLDWIAYTKEKLNGRNSMIMVAEKGTDLGGFIYMRIIDYHPQKQDKSLLQRFRKRSDQKITLLIKPLRWGVIEECYVVTSLRRQGIGRELTSHALHWFRANNISRIEVSVLAQNTVGESFWKKLGFETFRLSMSKSI